jgi:hydroxyacylglutathione hydrolase
MENVIGYLEDGVAGWIKNGFRLEYIPQITAQEFAELQEQGPDGIGVLDVREPSEVASGMIDESTHIPLGQLKSRAGELDRNKLLVVYCRSGYRSSIATSLLRRAGFRDIANLTGGYEAWKTAAFPAVVTATAN